jgi:hypothetical protein
MGAAVTFLSKRPTGFLIYVGDNAARLGIVGQAASSF